MSELINLNRARKARTRADKEAAAGANRVKHGRTKAEKLATKAQAERAARLLDQTRREP